MSLFNKHEALVNEAIAATLSRNYYTPYPEIPKFYAEDGDAKAKAYISAVMNTNFAELLQANNNTWVGEEISPYLQLGIGVKYPTNTVENYMQHAGTAQKSWSKLSVQDRAGILIEVLERLKLRFFDIAYATMHTTGQPFRHRVPTPMTVP
jgi:hypothetical protein